MKNFFQPVFLLGLLASLTVSCQRNASKEIFIKNPGNPASTSAPTAAVAKKGAPQANCNPTAFTITLESRTLVNGNWEWVWSVQNSNPGNGNNGTVQDLSNWGMQLGTCVDWMSVVSAAYSGDGMRWTSFNPSYTVDPSQTCLNGPTLKFDFGTSSSTKSYYRLVVNQDFEQGFVQGYYKSGSSTGCCTIDFIGISGCGGTVEEVVE